MNKSDSNSDMTPKTCENFWDIFGEMLVRFVEIPEGARVLDVGSGGGSVLYPLAKRVGLKGKVIGIDICDHCATTTALEIDRCGIKNAESVFMDAIETEFEDTSFDCITAGFIGWEDYFDFTANEYIKDDLLMKKIARVLKPGGLFGLSSWLYQEDLDWMHQFFASQSIKSRKNYNIESEAGWRKILDLWGFTDIKVYVERTTFDYDSIDSWWTEMSDYNWIEDDEDDDIVQPLKDLAYERIKPKVSEGMIPITREAMFVVAKKK